MKRQSLLLLFVIAAALTLSLPLQPALAAVELVEFKATAQADNTILVEWVTGTERDTVGFRVYRAESASPATWGDPVNTQPAQGNAITGGTYQFVDANVVAGVLYYYQLRELTGTGEITQQTVSASIGAVTNPPTVTNTPGTGTPTPARTPTTTRVIAPVASLTPTLTPPPTATRQFTNTPAVSPVQTPVGQAAATVTPIPSPTRSPLPPASVASPTGRAPLLTAPPLIAATATPSPTLSIPATVQVVAQVPTMTPTFDAPTATARARREVTPIVFAASETREAPAVTPAVEVGTQGRTTTLALLVGGSAIGLAGLLAAALLFARSRRT